MKITLPSSEGISLSGLKFSLGIVIRSEISSYSGAENLLVGTVVRKQEMQRSSVQGASWRLSQEERWWASIVNKNKKEREGELAVSSPSWEGAYWCISEFYYSRRPPGRGGGWINVVTLHSYLLTRGTRSLSSHLIPVHDAQRIQIGSWSSYIESIFTVRRFPQPKDRLWSYLTYAIMDKVVSGPIPSPCLISSD